MKQINILIVVDTESALASGDLGGNVYLIDTNKFFGSYNIGQEELVSACSDGQVIIWSVTPVNPGNDAQISGFTGEMITKKVCVPEQGALPGTGDIIWSARVQTQGATAKYQYSCDLTFDGKTMTFDPYIDVKAN